MLRDPCVANILTFSTSEGLGRCDNASVSPPTGAASSSLLWQDHGGMKISAPVNSSGLVRSTSMPFWFLWTCPRRSPVTSLRLNKRFVVRVLTGAHLRPVFRPRVNLSSRLLVEQTDTISYTGLSRIDVSRIPFLWRCSVKKARRT